MTSQEDILRVTSPGEEFTTDDLMDRLTGHRRKSILSVINRLTVSGIIELTPETKDAGKHRHLKIYRRAVG